MTFESDILGFKNLVSDALDNVFKDVVISIGDTVVRFSPVYSGRFRANWQLTEGSPSTISLNAYDYTGMETVSNMIDKAGGLTAGEVAYIVNNLTYGYEIETAGWPSGKEAYKPVRKTEVMFDKIVKEVIEARRIK